jgi:hypothetical protein
MTNGQEVDGFQKRFDKVWGNPSWWNLVVVLPWVVGMVFFVREWNVDRTVATRQQTTQEKITAHEPSNHNRFGYAFTVNGRIYHGWQSPKAEELEIGKVVVVYYDPMDPTKNALVDFSELGLQALGPIPMMTIGIAAVAVFIFRRRHDNLEASKIPA